MNRTLIKKTRGFTRPNFSKRNLGGFTLIEMIVSLGIFTITLFIATSTFLVILNADRHSRATRVAMDNMNIMLEDMSRRIKTGTLYTCGGDEDVRTDCPPPNIISSGVNSTFAFTDQNGNRTIYKKGEGSGAIAQGPSNELASGGCGNSLYRNTGLPEHKCLLRSDDDGQSFVRITSPELNIVIIRFFVTGTAPCGAVAPSPVCVGDAGQPAVIITVEGTTGFLNPNPALNASFRVQTTIAQRAYDN